MTRHSGERRVSKRADSPARVRRTAKQWKKVLDKLCREVVFQRDGHQCVRCGKRDKLQWSHVKSRAIMSCRYSLWNSKTLCAGCHLLWHHSPVESVGWWAAKYPERYLELRAWRPGKVDYAAIELYLKSQLAGGGPAAIWDGH